MRRPLLGLFFAAFLLAVSGPVVGQDAPVKWEYATLTLRILPSTKEGAEKKSGHFLLWETSAGKIVAPDWRSLSEKLKVELPADSVSRTVPPVQLLNHFGDQGWEMIAFPDPATERYIFKRRLGLASKEAEPVLYFPTKGGAKRVFERRSGDTKTELAETVTKVENEGRGFRVTCERTDGKVTGPTEYLVSARGVSSIAVGLESVVVLNPMLKLPAKAGDSWTHNPSGKLDWTYTIGKEEEIEVPAGKFKAIPVVRTPMSPKGKAPVIITWFALDIGLIKTETKLEGAPERESITVLKSFTPGK